MQTVGPGSLGRSATPDQISLLCLGCLPGASINLSLDGKSWAGSAESGKELKQFGWIHESPPVGNEIYASRIAELARAELILHPKK